MIPPATAISSGLTWTRLPRNRGCELKRHDQLIGTLQHSSKWACDYVASTAAEQWTFRRSGFWGTGAEIVDTTSQQTIASFKPAWPSKGTLTFSDGQSFSVECKGLWHPTWTMRTPNGEVVVSLRVREETIQLGDPETVPESRRLQLLIMFALYRVRQAEEDAASAAMVASIA